jgi:hypothetical protein
VFFINAILCRGAGGSAVLSLPVVHGCTVSYQPPPPAPVAQQHGSATLQLALPVDDDDYQQQQQRRRGWRRRADATEGAAYLLRGEPSACEGWAEALREVRLSFIHPHSCCEGHSLQYASIVNRGTNVSNLGPNQLIDRLIDRLIN